MIANLLSHKRNYKRLALLVTKTLSSFRYSKRDIKKRKKTFI